MLLVAAGLALAQPLLIRRANIDITPPEPLPLGGYTERHGKVMEPGGEPLYARCIDLKQGTTTVAVVSVDMLTIPESLYREVASRIPKDVHLFLQATHTHCAPDSQMLNDRMTFAIPGIAGFKRRWLAWYADKIASAVTAAESSAPYTCNSLTTTTAQVDANRARRKGGKPDKRLIRVRTDQRQEDGFPPLDKDVFTFYTAHPTIHGPEMMKTSGDWVSALASDNSDIVLNGAIGDVSPAADGPDYPAKLAAFMHSIRLGLSAPKVSSTVWTSKSSIVWNSQAVQLDTRKPHPTFAKTNGIPEALAQSLVNQFAPQEDRIVAFALGKLAIVGVPGEPTSILGNQIQAAGEKLGFSTVLVCSHVDGWMGYILDPVDYDQGGYEATLSFYGREEGQKVVGAAIACLRSLRRSGNGN